MKDFCSGGAQRKYWNWSDKTEKELSEQDRMIEGTVSVGCGDLASVRVLPELFPLFTAVIRPVSFDLHTATVIISGAHGSGTDGYRSAAGAGKYGEI